MPTKYGVLFLTKFLSTTSFNLCTVPQLPWYLGSQIRLLKLHYPMINLKKEPNGLNAHFFFLNDHSGIKIVDRLRQAYLLFSKCQALVNHREKNQRTRKRKCVMFVGYRVLQKRRPGLGTGSPVTHASHVPICQYQKVFVRFN